MSLPDRHNPYFFEAFLDILHGFDFYAADPPFEQLDADSRRRAVDWEKFVVDACRVYQEAVLKEVGPASIVGPEKMSLPELWDSITGRDWGSWK